MPKRSKPTPTIDPDAGEDDRVALIYHLNPAKRQKKEDPFDTSLQEAAAKKLAKTQDAQTLKKIGANPADQMRVEGLRTGLRNLGATCYMNSLLQCLFMNIAFRKGIYSWEPTLLTAAASYATQLQAHRSPEALGMWRPGSTTRTTFF